MFAETANVRDCPVNCLNRRSASADYFDKRHQMRRIERVNDDEAAR